MLTKAVMAIPHFSFLCFMFHGCARHAPRQSDVGGCWQAPPLCSSIRSWGQLNGSRALDNGSLQGKYLIHVRGVEVVRLILRAMQMPWSRNAHTSATACVQGHCLCTPSKEAGDRDEDKQ